MKNFIVEYYREADHKSVLDQITKNGGIIVSMVKVPFWNIHKQIVGTSYIVLYQAEKEIGIEVLT